ncbi:hypothetical protein PUN28_017633 [Cardiocondyla obscurior]|uniref:Uncharacterized protein n=1 Tax=Cardiocondyla obscurior TaxID=286306 RepID=A0AAW2EMA5_9HYME
MHNFSFPRFYSTEEHSFLIITISISPRKIFYICSKTITMTYIYSSTKIRSIHLRKDIKCIKQIKRIEIKNLTKDLCDRGEIDLYAVEGSAAREQINLPDATSTAETKITSAINDVIDFADCCISHLKSAGGEAKKQEKKKVGRVNTREIRRDLVNKYRRIMPIIYLFVARNIRAPFDCYS